MLGILVAGLSRRAAVLLNYCQQDASVQSPVKEETQAHDGVSTRQGRGEL